MARDIPASASSDILPASMVEQPSPADAVLAAVAGEPVGADGWRVAVLAVDDLAYKRRLLDDMEALRAPRAATPAVSAPRLIPPAPRAGQDETDALRDRLRTAEATCALLEGELANLERQTLAAMAEAGRLRQALDQVEKDDAATGMGEWRQERANLTRRLAETERARDLLTAALMDSETEIARLTRTLEGAIHKLSLAG